MNPRRPIGDPPDGFFAVADYLRAARRELDVSQRELASRLGVSASKVARAEGDGAGISLRYVLDVLSEAGWRLTVVDGEGAVVVPAPTLVDPKLRDRSGRRFPAHLDVRPAAGTWWAMYWPSMVDKEPDYTFDLSRTMRDFEREDHWPS